MVDGEDAIHSDDSVKIVELSIRKAILSSALKTAPEQRLEISACGLMSVFVFVHVEVDSMTQNAKDLDLNSLGGKKYPILLNSLPEEERQVRKTRVPRKIPHSEKSENFAHWRTFMPQQGWEIHVQQHLPRELEGWRSSVRLVFASA